MRVARAPRWGAALAAAIALALLPSSANARVDLVANGRGDQFLLHQILGQTSRPLFGGTRPAAGRFEPLAPIGQAADFGQRSEVMDDSGGTAAAWLESSPDGSGKMMVATRPAGGSFTTPAQLDGLSAGLLLAGNARGDVLAVWYPYGGPTRYSFRPAGGAFGQPAPAPLEPFGIAVDPDGTAIFVGTHFDPASGEHHLVESRLPPGGQATDPKPISSSSVFDVEFGAAPDGRALVVWRTRKSLSAVERLPGGDFGAEFTIPSPSPEAPIGSVRVASSGAAAISLGFRGDGAAFRDPGGSFLLSSTAAKTGGNSARLAVGERGDAVLTWHPSAGNVRAAYRAAGARGWSRPLTIAPRRPFAPDAPEPPALTVAADGTATAAWEESDGVTVRTFTRDFRGSSLGARTPVDSAPSYFAEAPPEACRPSGAHVLVTSARATVFSKKGTTFGCLLDRGVPVALGDSLGTPPFPSHTMALAGPLVAYGSDFEDQVEPGSVIEVLDLRDPEFGSGTSRGWSLERTDFATLLGTKLRANGAVAWMSCPGNYAIGPPVRRCRRGGGLAKHVWVWGARRGEPRMVGSGRHIRPATFRLHGSVLSWREGRKLRTARLR